MKLTQHIKETEIHQINNEKDKAYWILVKYSLWYPEIEVSDVAIISQLHPFDLSKIYLSYSVTVVAIYVVHIPYEGTYKCLLVIQYFN